MRKIAYGLVIALFALGVLYIGRPLLMPFVLAVAIWCLINILTEAFAKPLPLVRIRVPRPLAFCAALVTIIGAVYLASWIITNNINQVVERIPVYQYNLEMMGYRIQALMPWNETFTLSGLISGLDFNSAMRRIVGEVTNALGKGTIVAIYLLFLFLEQGSFRSKLSKLIANTDSEKNIDFTIKQVSNDIRAYVGIKTAASLITAILSYVIFKIIGLDFASFWAFLIFLFNFIPAIGSIVSTALPTIFAFLQYESLGPFLAVLIGVTTLQMLIGNILEPRFQGDRLNLSPLVILLSLALWNIIWGIPGMFLCVPLTSIAMIIFSRIPQTQKIAIALSRNGEILLTADEVEEAQLHCEGRS
ncbi:MAG: AI-2E family transporter [Chitinispirillales bacterium]|jgi:predicted PurR-regulated permease PerM|nr:AI-2E family transporter [Chitinispirillales bacterium]